MEMKKFMDIQRMRSEWTDVIREGDYLWIEEKIDGANCGIRYDKENDRLVAQSRNRILEMGKDDLRGFGTFVELLNAKPEWKVPMVQTIFHGDSNLVLFGEWLCLSGDTIIRKTSGGKNSNYMTLREMYGFKYKNSRGENEGFKRGYPMILHFLNNNNGEATKKTLYTDLNIGNDSKALQNSIENGYVEYNAENDMCILTPKGKENYWQLRFEKSWWGRNGFPSIFSLDIKQDKIVSNQIADIVYTGVKEVYRVTTRKGFEIKATLTHPFYTPTGFKPLSELKVYDCVAISDLTNQRGHRRLGPGSREILNAQDAYKKKIGYYEICGRDSCLALHHKDENYLNNDVSNWQVLCVDCHNKIHEKKKFNGFEYDYEFDYITNIEKVGEEDCYDIAMTGDENIANFVANGFIVHNCKHTVTYKDSAYNKMYCYDMYDAATGKYLPQEEVYKRVGAVLNLSGSFCAAPVFYKGTFISWEHIMEFVGKSAAILGGSPTGEGIVIKNQTRLNDPDNKKPFYVKIVTEKFKEVQKCNHIKKELDPTQLAAEAANVELAQTIVTEARVRKMLNKLVDEGILDVTWDERHMPIVAKNLPKRIVEDCIQEESDIVAQIANFGKVANKITMSIAKKLVGVN